jgi:hypothetical protein
LSLDALSIGSVTSLHVSGLFASDGVSGPDRYLSGNYLGLSAPDQLDGLNNFGFTNFVSLQGLPVVLPSSGATGDVVWVNELHYRNLGDDVGEGVEIAGQAGTDLAGYSLLLFDGASGLFYQTNHLAGIIDDEGCGYGAVWFPIPGLQDGAPDGLALVHLGTGVIHFLSYEGNFIGAADPVAGKPTDDIGALEEADTMAGYSLQRTGAGITAIEFPWQGPGAASPGHLNAGQLIAPCPAADGDHDGLPDLWEALNGLDPLDTEDGAADFDGDGHSNLQEYLAGTQHTNANSVFAIQDLTKASPGALYFPSATGRFYSLFYSTSLLHDSAWTPLTNSIPGTGGTIMVPDTHDVELRFYRVHADWPLSP